MKYISLSITILLSYHHIQASDPAKFKKAYDLFKKVHVQTTTELDKLKESEQKLQKEYTEIYQQNPNNCTLETLLETKNEINLKVKEAQERYDKGEKMLKSFQEFIKKLPKT